MSTSTTIKVTPTSRGNFSKLRKYKTGGDIPKYQNAATGEDGIVPKWYRDRYLDNAALHGWNKNLNSARAGATIYGGTGSSLHGNAGDLDYVYRSNAAYTQNRDAIGSDLSTWFKSYK